MSHDDLARRITAMGVKLDPRPGSGAIVLALRQSLRERRAARRTLQDPAAPPVARTIAEAVSGALTTSQASRILSDDPRASQAIVNLAGAQAGDVTIGDVAGGDMTKINIILVINGGAL